MFSLCVGAAGGSCASTEHFQEECTYSDVICESD